MLRSRSWHAIVAASTDSSPSRGRSWTPTIDLTQRHRLRAYDAVQLATAPAANAALLAAGLPSLTFVAADSDLSAVARAQGLVAADPNLYP